MKLSQFREKLLVEVEAAQALDGRDRLQPHLYCIAALLRKIFSRIGDTVKITVRILPFDADFLEREETLAARGESQGSSLVRGRSIPVH